MDELKSKAPDPWPPISEDYPNIVEQVREACEQIKANTGMVVGEEVYDVEQFLAAYDELCRKSGMVVGSCGCCSSPWVEIASPRSIDEHIEHLREQEIKK